MRKSLPKRKKGEITKLKLKLEKLVKDHVKRRDDYTCQKCGKYLEKSDCHASHVIPVSRGNALAFEPINLKTLCMYCHLHWWHKNPLEASEWFKNKFPDRWDYLQEHKNDIVRWKASDYQQMIEEAKEW